MEPDDFLLPDDLEEMLDTAIAVLVDPDTEYISEKKLVHEQGGKLDTI